MDLLLKESDHIRNSERLIDEQVTFLFNMGSVVMMLFHAVGKNAGA
jgi:hypothetical protein